MNKKGFTLIELLIVVTIIGILAVALVPKIIGGSASARDSRRMTDVSTITSGLEYYLMEMGDFDTLNGAGKVAGATICASDLADDLAGFIKKMPGDPISDNDNDSLGATCTGDYVVLLMDDASTNLTKYAVSAALEDPSEGDENVYLEPGNETDYASFIPDAYDASDLGYYIVY